MRRIRISLRELLLITALLAVTFAWIAARLELRRINARGELRGIELWRDFALHHPDIYTSQKAWRSNLEELETNIAERRNRLGESDEHR